MTVESLVLSNKSRFRNQKRLSNDFFSVKFFKKNPVLVPINLVLLVLLGVTVSLFVIQSNSISSKSILADSWVKEISDLHDLSLPSFSIDANFAKQKLNMVEVNVLRAITLQPDLFAVESIKNEH